MFHFDFSHAQAYIHSATFFTQIIPISFYADISFPLIKATFRLLLKEDGLQRNQNPSIPLIAPLHCMTSVSDGIIKLDQRYVRKENLCQPEL